MSANNVHGWEIVRKMTTWPKSEASRPNVKLWGQYLRQKKTTANIQASQKMLIYFRTLPLIFRSRGNCPQKSQWWSDGECVSANSFLISLESTKRVRFSFTQKNRDEKIKLWGRVFSSGFVSFRRMYSENKYGCKRRVMRDKCPVIFCHATYSINTW